MLTPYPVPQGTASQESSRWTAPNGAGIPNPPKPLPTLPQGTGGGRRDGGCACGTLTPNSLMSRRRYVRCSPSARAVRVRLPPSWKSVASINRRLNSVTAPWKPGGGLGGPGGGAVGSAGGVGMRLNIARHVPRPDRGHFEEMTTRDVARCTAACARSGRRCPQQWACAPHTSRHGAMRG